MTIKKKDTIIVLLGNHKSGKDTVANFVSFYNPKVKKYSFSDKLYSLLEDLNIYPKEYIIEHKRELNEVVKKVADLYLTVFGSRYFAEQLLMKLDQNYYESKFFKPEENFLAIITDMRFESEYFVLETYAKAKGIKIVYAEVRRYEESLIGYDFDELENEIDIVIRNKPELGLMALYNEVFDKLNLANI